MSPAYLLIVTKSCGPAGRLTLDTGDEHKGAATPSPSPEDEIAFSFEVVGKGGPAFAGARI